MHTTTTAPHTCPFCDAPTDRLMCWKCSNGEDARHLSVYHLPAKPRRQLQKPQPATSTAAPRTIAELSTRPHYAPALQALMARPGTHAAAQRLIAAQKQSGAATLTTARSRSARRATSKNTSAKQVKANGVCKERI
jgi:hypothetical protein